jgi:hypothetical protein
MGCQGVGVNLELFPWTPSIFDFEDIDEHSMDSHYNWSSELISFRKDRALL